MVHLTRKKPQYIINFPLKWFISVLSITSLLLNASRVVVSWQSYVEWKNSAAKVVRLQELIGIIKTSDEILTMSARLAAATGDPEWEERYLKSEPILDAAIKEAMQILPDKRLSDIIFQN